MLDRRSAIDFFRSNLESCRLCPRMCSVNRLKGELGFCKADSHIKIASYCLHTGEEPPISGRSGSGAVFFAHCNMRCVYCQNYPISQLGYGNYTTVEELAGMMLSLEKRGAQNINLVTPTHYLPGVVEAILAARHEGLSLPVVYNVSGYESVDTIRMLSGIVQVYLVDFSDTPDYPHHNRLAVTEIFRQVGPLRSLHGVAVEGMIIRHLLLPGLLGETENILRFVSETLSARIPISLMSQYFPAHRALTIPALARKITREEYRAALGLLDRCGLTRGWVQDPDSHALPVA
jgi:putative pyruvate formate lyase activating enzyme